MRLYIHWPFCISRCTYCDFNARVARAGIRDKYHAALLEELSMWSRTVLFGDESLRSIYLGGGTPSTMRGTEAASLLGEIKKRFEVDSGAEITIEVNPATWSRDDFERALAGGINRFSIGVQSFHENALQLLGRAHDAAGAFEAVRDACDCGAPSISIDLLYGLPGMRAVDLLADLEQAMQLRPHHVSLYALTLPGKTRLAAMVRAGDVSMPGEEDIEEQYLAAVAYLRRGGYEQYEISNFALRGHHSRHNAAYWTREEYLGVGAGAHSLLGRCRFANSSSVLAYTRRLQSGNLAVQTCELLGQREEHDEKVMLGLRTSQGIPDHMLTHMGGRIEEFKRRGFLKEEAGYVMLTPRGMMVSNAVILELIMA